MWIVTQNILSNFWYILNTETKKSKKIGKVHGRGINYYDRARKECLDRNLRDYGKEVTMLKDGSLYDREGNYVGNYEGQLEISQAFHS